MSNIDNRIVEMRFDNKQFEAGVKQTNTSLENLKKNLQLEESAKGLAKLEKAGRNFSMGNLTSAVEGIAGKFSVFGIMGVTALQNITNAAINTGKNIVKALTIDPVTTGFDEYETKMNAIKTILANTKAKGTSLDDVNKSLAELNDYADKTVYNFAQMTDMVSKFATKSGDLDSSVSIVKGMANLAAEAGVGNQQLQGALYQASQIAESVKAMDWMSIENANLGTVKFKDDLIAMAKTMGTMDAKTLSMFKHGESFRDTLTNGWLTKGVFTAVTSMYALDDAMTKAAGEVNTLTKMFSVMAEFVQSGWAISWENILGNKDESSRLFGAISEGFGSIVGASADARNSLLAYWKANGGRQAIIEGLANALSGLATVIKPIESAFKEIFPPMTGEKLVALSKGFRDLMSGFVLGESASENLKRTFKGLFAVLDLGGKAFSFVANAIGMVIRAFLPGAGGGLVSITGGLGDFLVILNESATEGKVFEKALTKVADAIAFLKSNMAPLIPIIQNWFKGISESVPASVSFGDATTVLGAALSKIKMAISDVVSWIAGKYTPGATTAGTATSNFGGALSTLGTKISGVGGGLSDFVKTLVSGVGPGLQKIADMLNGISFKDLGSLLTGGGFFLFAKALNKGIGSVDKVLDGFSGVLREAADTLKAFQTQIKANAILKIAMAIGILAASLIALSFVKVENLAKSLGALTIMLGELVAVMFVMGSMEKPVKMAAVTAQIVALGVGLLLLAGAVKVLSNIDPKKLTAGVLALTVLMTELTIFTKIGKTATTGLIGFSVGLLALTGALSILAAMDVNALAKGGVALTGLVMLLGLFVTMTKGGNLAKSASGLIAFSVGIMALTASLALLATLDEKALTRGGIAIAGLVLVVATFVKQTNGMSLAKSASGLIAFSVGMMVLSQSLVLLGNLDTGALIQGSIAIVTLIKTIGAFVKATNGADLATSSAGMIAFAVGLGVLSLSVKMLSGMDPFKLAAGAGAIMSLMLAVGAMVKLTNGADFAMSSMSMIGFATGISILASSVLMLALIDAGKIAQGTGAIVGIMLALGAFIKLTDEGDLSKSAGGIIKFSVGVAILSGSLALLSMLDTGKLLMAAGAISALLVSMALLSKFKKGEDAFSALGKIADAGKTLASAVLLLSLAGAITAVAFSLKTLSTIDPMSLVISLGAIAATFVILGVAGALLTPLTPAILALSIAIGILGVGALAAGVGFKAFTSGMADVVKYGQAFSISLAGIVTAVGSAIVRITGKLGEGIIAFALAIQNGIPQLVTVGKTLIVAIGNALTEIGPTIVKSASTFLLAMLNEISKYVRPLADIGLKLIFSFLKAISDNIQGIVEVASDIIVGLLTGLAKKLPYIIQAGVEVISALLLGIGREAPKIVDAGFQMMIDFINGLAKTIEEKTPMLMEACAKLGGSIVKGVGSGIEKGAKGLLDGVSNVANNAAAGLTNGLNDAKKKAADTMTGIGNSMLGAINNTLGINSPAKELYDTGEYTGQGLANGLNSMADLVRNAGKDMGLDAMTGVTKGITSGTPAVTKASGKAAKSAYDATKDWVDEKKYYNQLSLAQELKAWEDVRAKYKVDSEERKKIDREVYRVKNEMIKADYDAAVKAIDDKKYYNQESLKQELKDWEAIQKKYPSGDERIKADREVYRVKQELIKEEQDAQKKSYDLSVTWINDRKYYAQLSLTEELAAWERVQARYKAGSEERKNADKEVYRVNKEIADATKDNEKQIADIRKDAAEKRKDLEDDYYAKSKEINNKLISDIENVTKEYENAIDSRAKTLYSSYSLFDEVKTPDTFSGEVLTKNLEDQVKSFETWQKTISELAQKGITDGLLKELQDMGPSALGQISALNSMSETDLQKYVSLWQTKSADARTQAVGELESTRIQMLSKIAELNSNAAGELNDYYNMWQDKLRLVNDNAADQLTTLETAFSTKIGAIKTDTTTKTDQMSQTVQTTTTKMAEETVKTTDKLGTDMAASVGTMRTGVESQFVQMATDIKVVMTKQGWEDIGANIVNGMIAGIQMKASALASSAAATALLALNSAKSALGIHSPSKEFEKVGVYAGQGLINGLDGSSGAVETSANYIGKAAITSLKEAISGLSDVVNGNIDITPTIRPVIDLTDVKSGAKTINGMLGVRQGLNVASINDRISTINVRGQNEGSNVQPTTNTTSPTTIQLTQNNYSPTALSRIEIYRQTRNQLSALKGLVGTS